MLHFVLGFSLFSPNALLDVGDPEESEDAIALEDTKKSKRVKRVKRVKKSKRSATKSSSAKSSSAKSSSAKSSSAKSSSTKRSSTKRSTKKVKLSRSQKAAKAKSQRRSSTKTAKAANGSSKTRTVTKSRTVKTRADRNSPRTAKAGKVRTTKRTTKIRTVETQGKTRSSKSGQAVKSRQEGMLRQSKSGGARKAESNLRVQSDRQVDNRRVDNRRVDNRRSSDMKQADAQRGQLPNVRKQENVKNKWKHGKNHPPRSRVVKPSYTPKGWTPSTHRHGMSENDPRYYAAGVFYYNQPPRENVTIIEHNYYGQQVSTYQAPKRQVDYRKSLSFGLRGGAQTSNINDGAEGSGLGFAVGYRLFEPIGVEFAYMNYGDEIDMDMDSPGQLSGQLFLFPWTKVSPYVTGGVTFAKNNEAANQTDVNSVPDGYAYGPHGGVGVQFGLGRFGLNVEGRYNTFSNVEEKSRLQGLIGLDYHF